MSPLRKRPKRTYQEELLAQTEREREQANGPAINEPDPRETEWFEPGDYVAEQLPIEVAYTDQDLSRQPDDTYGEQSGYRDGDDTQEYDEEVLAKNAELSEVVEPPSPEDEYRHIQPLSASRRQTTTALMAIVTFVLVMLPAVTLILWLDLNGEQSFWLGAFVVVGWLIVCGVWYRRMVSAIRQQVPTEAHLKIVYNTRTVKRLSPRALSRILPLLDSVNERIEWATRRSIWYWVSLSRLPMLLIVAWTIISVRSLVGGWKPDFDPVVLGVWLGVSLLLAGIGLPEGLVMRQGKPAAGRVSKQVQKLMHEARERAYQRRLILRDIGIVLLTLWLVAPGWEFTSEVVGKAPWLWLLVPVILAVQPLATLPKWMSWYFVITDQGVTILEEPPLWFWWMKRTPAKLVLWKDIVLSEVEDPGRFGDALFGYHTVRVQVLGEPAPDFEEMPFMPDAEAMKDDIETRRVQAKQNYG